MSDNLQAQDDALLQKTPKEAIHPFLDDVYDYIDFVNRVSEVIRLSEGIGTEPLDRDMTVGDVMLSLIRKGERLRFSAERLHDYANNQDT